jgi:hypothetical protein
MRSKYVYLIFRDGIVLSVHTVKYEARMWLFASEWEWEDIAFCRMRDGGGQMGRDERLVVLSQLEAMA